MSWIHSAIMSHHFVKQLSEKIIQYMETTTKIARPSLKLECVSHIIDTEDEWMIQIFANSQEIPYSNCHELLSYA